MQVGFNLGLGDGSNGMVRSLSTALPWNLADLTCAVIGWASMISETAGVPNPESSLAPALLYHPMRSKAAGSCAYRTANFLHRQRLLHL